MSMLTKNTKNQQFMDGEATFKDVLALRALEEEHHDGYSLRSIGWVIGVVIVIAIIAYWITHHQRYALDDHRGHGELRGEHGHMCKQVDKLEALLIKLAEKEACLEGKVYESEKYTGYELRKLDQCVFPCRCEDEFFGRGFEGRRGERRGERGECGCGGNCGKRYDLQQTFTPGTSELIVSDVCRCG